MLKNTKASLNFVIVYLVRQNINIQRRLAMEKSNKLDFGGQHIYVGMDVHKKSWSVSIHTEQFEHKTFTQPPEIEKLTYYLQRTFPERTCFFHRKACNDE